MPAEEAAPLAVPSVEQPPAAEVPADEPVVEVLTTGSSGAGSLPKWVLVGTAVSTILLVVFGSLAFLSWRDAAELRDGADAAKAVRATVSKDVESLLSYDYKTYDEDVAKAEQLLTPEFRKEYAPTVDSIRDAALEQKRTQQATVVAVSVVESSPDEVKTLLFVNTTTFTESDQRQRLLQNRIGVTMVKSGDRWRISDVTFPQT